MGSLGPLQGVSRGAVALFFVPQDSCLPDFGLLLPLLGRPRTGSAPEGGISGPPGGPLQRRHCCRMCPHRPQPWAMTCSPVMDGGWVGDSKNSHCPWLCQGFMFRFFFLFFFFNSNFFGKLFPMVDTLGTSSWWASWMDGVSPSPQVAGIRGCSPSLETHCPPCNALWLFSAQVRHPPHPPLPA